MSKALGTKKMWQWRVFQWFFSEHSFIVLICRCHSCASVQVKPQNLWSDYKLSRISQRAPEHQGKRKCELVSECLELETWIFQFVPNFLGERCPFSLNKLHAVCCLLTRLCPFPALSIQIYGQGSDPSVVVTIQRLRVFFHQRPVCCKLCPSERRFQGGDDFLFHCPIWMFVVGNPSGAAVYLPAGAACQVGFDKVIPTLLSHVL